MRPVQSPPVWRFVRAGSATPISPTSSRRLPLDWTPDTQDAHLPSPTHRRANVRAPAAHPRLRSKLPSRESRSFRRVRQESECTRAPAPPSVLQQLESIESNVRVYCPKLVSTPYLPTLMLLPLE